MGITPAQVLRLPITRPPPYTEPPRARRFRAEKFHESGRTIDADLRVRHFPSNVVDLSMEFQRRGALDESTKIPAIMPAS